MKVNVSNNPATETNITSHPVPRTETHDDTKAVVVFGITNHQAIYGESPLEAKDQEPLTEQDEADLKRCETIFRRNQESFEEAGEALYEIWKKKLFRNKYKSFKAYCEPELKCSRSYGHRLVKVHEQNVSTIGDTSIPIQNEHQARKARIKAAKNKVQPAKKETVEPHPISTTDEKPQDNVIQLPQDKVLMSWPDINNLIVQIYNDYNNSQDAKVGEGLRKLKAESRKWTDYHERLTNKQQEVA